MRELCWSLWRQRWAVLFLAVTVVLGAGMLYAVIAVGLGFRLFELGYRIAFVLLQTVFMILQRERFLVVLRKEREHRFYRSMPHAWEKEQRRFMRLDVFCAVTLTGLLIVGSLVRNGFADSKVPFALVVFFLVYMVISRIMACVPYVWWIPEIVFAVVFLLVPALDISPLLCGGTAVAVGAILGLLYGFVRKLWETED